MENLNDIDFMAVGKHCSVTECRQLDYLPFTCEFCKKEHCLQHKDEHSCSEKVDKDSKLPKCPLCLQYIEKGINGSNDNTQVERHIQSGCQELLFKKRRKNRCTFDHCRQINLIPLNCDKCYMSFCVRHRHSSDHNCIQQRKGNNSRLIMVR